jgi:hypothetical protein
MCVFVRYSLCCIPTVCPEILLLCDVRVTIREIGVRPPIAYVQNTLKNEENEGKRANKKGSVILRRELMLYSFGGPLDSAVYPCSVKVSLIDVVKQTHEVRRNTE